MDYLVIEGFKSAAEEFSREAGVGSPVDLDSIESRMNIREALQRGDVSEAIARVNDLNPEVSVWVAVMTVTTTTRPSTRHVIRSEMIQNFSCTTLRPSGR